MLLNHIFGVFIVFLHLDLSSGASLSADEQNHTTVHSIKLISEEQKYKHLIEGQGLYTTDDDVQILTAKNIKKLLYKQKHVWFVEFYNSWCGFCQRFANSWKALGSDIRDWKDRILVGAVDCANDDNNVICREFEIMHYPSLRYFHENYEERPKSVGDEILKGPDLNALRYKLLKKIVTEQQQGRGISFPNLIPYDYSSTNYFFTYAPRDMEYGFLILEEPKTLLGAEVALDLQKVPNISIRYAFNNNIQLINNLNVQSFPHVVVLSNKRDPRHISGRLDSRESLRNAIIQYLKNENIDIDFVTPVVNTKNLYTGRWIEAKVPNITFLMEAREKKKLQEKIKKMGDVVFQMDLETALRYSLKHEVANVKVISEEKLHSLNEYLTVVAKYFPVGRQGREFLMELRDKVESSGKSIKGSEISDFLENAEKQGVKLFSSPQQWLACKGSSRSYRGYPCGLWKMFHFLTVSFAEQNSEKFIRNPREVLDAMHGYIKHFFGCTDCSQHFQEMAVAKDMKSVSSVDSAVLWLWAAHNDVNKRLSHDLSEDPEFPKYQFPLVERCSLCKNSDSSWNYPEVLKYVKNMYSSVNIRYIGSDTEILHLGLESSLKDSQIANASVNFYKKIDASMCFILYVASFILILTLIRLFLKRGYRKTVYLHNLFGKV